ncbi:glycosyltransferase 87 family protein [Pseudonocardia endophytica]|uniref:Alpha-1,2-mannosyltransferase n=1 Tax=Pseudonocardia endophytica TaxID=401976 RepID=A0A4V2PII6_PSEEN|nr:glycosyltransferase 87 family protein [Pseudonocardia endophytica]TCK24746.1 alpha-1,2-mannosyltransferase [Pseudonocardia endophytica]
MTVTRTAPEPDAVVPRLRSALATPRIVAWVAVPLLVASLTWSWIRLGNYALDLDIYRLGVQMWLSGQDMYGTLPPPMNGPVLPFIYPVFAAIMMIPLSVVPYWVSLLLVFVLSVAALTVVIFLTARVAWPAGGRPGAVSATMLAVPAALLIEPVSQTLAFGQINLLLMVMVVVDCLAPRTRWPRGLMIGLAAAIKLTPAGFVLFLLLRRDYRAVAVAAATGVVATGIGFLVAPEESARYWFGGPAASVSGSTFFSNETIQAILARQEVGEPWFTLIWLAGVAVILVLGAPIIRRADRAVALAATAAVVLMASPTSWSHHWVFVVPALIALGTHAVRLRSWGWAAAAAVTAVIFYLAPFRWMPNVWGVQMRWSLWEQTLGASYVIVAVVLLGLGRWWYTRRPAMAPATADT